MLTLCKIVSRGHARTARQAKEFQRRCDSSIVLGIFAKSTRRKQFGLASTDLDSFLPLAQTSVKAAMRGKESELHLLKRPLPPKRTACADEALVERFDIEPPTLIFHPNDQTLQGSFSAVSTPNFARKYSLESS